MKTFSPYKLCILNVFLLFQGHNSIGQNTDWQHFYSGKNAGYITDDGNNIWATTAAGLAKVDKNSEAVVFYDKTNSGIPSTLLRGLAVDSSGHKWIGTTNQGLAQFNDTVWTVYNHLNSPLPDAPVNLIKVAPNGNVWVGFNPAGTNGGGVARWDGHNWLYWNMSNSNLPWNNVEDIAFHPDGSVWLALDGLCIARFDGVDFQHFTAIDLGLTGSYQIIALAIGPTGTVWAGLSSNNAVSILKFDGSTWDKISPTTHPGAPEGVWWRGMQINRWGRLQVAYFNKFYELYDNNFWGEEDLTSWIDEENPPVITGFLDSWDSFGNPIRWFVTGSGLHHDFNKTVELGNCPLLTDQIRSIAIEPGTEKVWATPYNKGLIVKDGDQWKTYNTDNSFIPTNFILGLRIDAQGKKWLATDMGMVAFDGISWQLFEFPELGFLWNIAIDSAGNKWLCSNVGLAKFDGTDLQIFNTQNSGIPFNQVFCAAVDREGIIWVGTTQGLAKFDGQTWETVIPYQYIADIAVDQNDVKWVAIYDGPYQGLVRIEGNQIKTSVDLNLQVTDPRTTSVNIGLDGSVWMNFRYGHDGFAVLHPNGVWDLIGSSNTPFSDYLSDVAFDKNGNAWLGAEGGIYRFHTGLVSETAGPGEHVSSQPIIATPTPANRSACLSIPDNQSFVPAVIIVTDMFGQVVHKGVFSGSDYCIDRGALPAGMYLFNILDNSGFSRSGKIIFTN